MAQTVLTVAGYWVGGMVGGPWGAQIGAALGSYLGAQYDISQQQYAGSRIDDLKAPRYEYGAPLVSVIGRARVMGSPLWMSAKREIATTTGGKGSASPEVTTFSYEVDLLLQVSERPITAVTRVWANGELIYTTLAASSGASIGASLATTRWSAMTVYTGDAAQLADPVYEASVGVGNAPAYRGRGTVMIEGLQLGNSGIVPALAFEVIEEGTPGTRWVETSTRPAHDLYLETAMAAQYPPPDLIEYGITGPAFQLGDGTRGGAAPNWHVRNDTAVTASGKRYFEWAVDMTGHSAAMETWVDIRGATDEVGASATGYYTSAGTVIAAPVEGYGRIQFGSTTSVPRILMVAVDFEAELYWVGMDGAWGTHPAPGAGMNTGNPATGVGGRPFNVNVPGGDVWIHFEIGYVSNPSCAASLRTTVEAFSHGPPDGFVPWSSDTAEAQVWTPADVDLADVVGVLCDAAGLEAAQFDASALAGVTFPGLPLTQVAPPRAALEALAGAFYFECVESDRLYFRPRGGAAAAALALDELAAGDGAASDTPPVLLERGSDVEVPARVSIQYINVDDDYQTGTAYADRQIGQSDQVQAFALPIVLTPARAQGVADTVALDVRVAASTAQLAIADTRPDLEPTDVVTAVDDAGITYRLRITQDVFSGGLHQLQAVLDDASVLATSGAAPGASPGVTVAPFAVASLVLVDTALLQDADDAPGHYVAIAGDGGRWLGATLYLSRDDGSTWDDAGGVLHEATVGTASTALAAWTGGNLFDDVNTVTVDVGAGNTLASSTRAALLTGQGNAMLVGDEVLQFRTATLVSDGVYTLSGLLRGRRGTEWACAAHVAGEPVVLLSRAGMLDVPIAVAEIGQTLGYRAVGTGRTLASAVQVQASSTSARQRPYAPTRARIARDGSNNATITWSRRSRLSCRFLAAGVPVPLGEAVEAYEVDIVSGGTVVRTISAASESASYSAAQQTADGLTPGAAITFRVYQLSATVGRGYPCEATR